MCVNPPTNSEHPTFGEIVRILYLMTQNNFCFVCTSHTYSSHFNAYQVVQNNQFNIISVSQLGIYEVYHKYIVSPYLYVVIKSYHHVEFDI